MPHSAFVQVRPEKLDALVEEERDRHAQALDDLLSTAFEAETPAKQHLMHGPPHVVVPELVRAEEIAVLVMGTVARTGLSGVVMGNTAERILDDLDWSVIAVKPPGFVSPVQVG